MGVTGNELLLQLDIWHIIPFIITCNVLRIFKRKEQLNEHKLLHQCQKINGNPKITHTKVQPTKTKNETTNICHRLERIPTTSGDINMSYDKFLWEYQCSLHPYKPKPPIDPLMKYCRCGYGFRPGLLMKMRMLVFGECSWRCPQCQTVMTFRLVYHVVKVDVKEVKGKERLWKKG